MTSGQSVGWRQSKASSQGSHAAMSHLNAWGLSLCGGLTISLFVARFYYVAESADRGETLGLVGLWLSLLALWTIAWRNSRTPLVPWQWVDSAVALLAGGHIVSSLRIIATVGDKRSAMNLAWEWVGIAVCWFLVRQQSVDAKFRRLFAAGIIATGAAIAGLGLYQHYIEFPAMALKYGSLFDRLKHADPVEAASLRQTLAKENIPVDGPGAILFEKRLRDSREPLGFFALANTLGGFLAVCLIIAVSLARICRPAKGRFVLVMGLIALVGWCLLLTKSRTAWIGTAVGITALLFGWRAATRSIGQFRLIAVALFLVILSSWGISRLGGLDSQVLTEAPKSLQYRLQYWVATSRMIRDHLVFGVGPGQFRSQYLYYKLPEASEEISDPHNLFFDVSANGGIVSLAGLVMLCVWLFQQLRPASRLVNVSIEVGSTDEMRVIKVIYGIAALAWVWMLVTGSDDRLLIILPVAAGLFWFIWRSIALFPEKEQAVCVGLTSAAVGLIVHLCGAGGIEMPAISILLLSLIACSVQKSDPGKIPQKPLSSSTTLLVLLFTGILLGTWYLTGMRPVMLVQEKLLAGDRHVEKSQWDQAEAQYASAAVADRLASEPWRRRAELAYRKSGSDQHRSNESFRSAVDLMDEAKVRDPAGFRDDLRLGEWWRARWRKTSNGGDIQESVKSFSRAFHRYPTNGILMADLALAMLDAGDEKEGGQMAQRALAQDEINHQWGHVDRFLDPSIRRRLESLTADQIPSEQNPVK